MATAVRSEFQIRQHLECHRCRASVGYHQRQVPVPEASSQADRLHPEVESLGELLPRRLEALGAWPVVGRRLVDLVTCFFSLYLLIFHSIAPRRDTGNCKVHKKALSSLDNAHLEELVENSLHPIVEELERWESIIGEHYLDYKLEEQRNSLAYKP